ncbi:MAG: hypothetical protein ACRCYD_09535 [Plesiomonas sp.]
MSYSTKRFGINFANIPARGLAADVDIEWELDADESTAYPDMTGTSGIIVHNNQTKGTARCTLQANSPTCKLWIAAYAASKASGEEPTLFMYDRNAETAAVAFAQKATMKRTPKMARGSGEPRVEFEFTFPYCTPPLQ